METQVTEASATYTIAYLYSESGAHVSESIQWRDAWHWSESGGYRLVNQRWSVALPISPTLLNPKNKSGNPLIFVGSRESTYYTISSYGWVESSYQLCLYLLFVQMSSWLKEQNKKIPEFLHHGFESEFTQKLSTAMLKYKFKIIINK